MPYALLSRRLAAAAAITIASLGAASSAHARSDVSFSIGIYVPGAHVQAAPVYVQPRSVYVQPHPVYVQPRPVYVQPAPIYMQPRPIYMQPPTTIYYDQRPGWHRGKGHHKHGHGHGYQGRFDNDGRYNDERGGHRR